MHLMEHLPAQVYSGETHVQDFQDALDAQLRLAQAARDDLMLQLRPETATWGLTRFEQEYGISTDMSQSYEQRRETLRAKRRSRGTATVAQIQRIAQSFSNSENTVIEHYSAYRFTIKFIGTIGIPPNMADLATAIEDCRPAHLAFDFAYTYNTHGNLSHFTHEAMRPRTHQELREANLN